MSSRAAEDAAARLDDGTLFQVFETLFGTVPELEEARRWFDQGLNYSNVPGRRYVIRQARGGPCGIIAPLQALVIKYLLYGSARTHKEAVKGVGAPDSADAKVGDATAASSIASSSAAAAAGGGGGGGKGGSSSAEAAAGSAASTGSHGTGGDGPDGDSPGKKSEFEQRAAALGNVTDARRRAALLDALAFALWQAALQGGDPLDPRLPANSDGSTEAVVISIRTGAPVPPPLTADGFTSFDAFERRTGNSLVDTRGLLEEHWTGEQLGGGSGVMLVVVSLLLSRGIQGVQEEDRDERDQALVQRFGNCGQELVNLMITGRATQNVFDGVNDVGGGFMMKGVMSRPYIGYISRLEFLRAVTVGSYLKEPRFPAWVVGSESHFSVLFSTDPKASEPAPESATRRVFDRHDVAKGGFVPNDAVGRILEELELPIAAQPVQLKRLLSAMDQGTGVVPWAVFWSTASGWLLESPPTECRPVVVDEAEAEAAAREAFTRADVFGGGFLQPEQVAGALKEMGVPCFQDLPAAATAAQQEQQRKEREELERKGKAKGTDGIVFFEPLWEVAGPAVVGAMLEKAEKAEEERARTVREEEKEKKEEEEAIRASLEGTGAAPSAAPPAPASSSSSSAAAAEAIDPDVVARLQAAVAAGTVPGLGDAARRAAQSQREEQLRAVQAGMFEVVEVGGGSAAAAAAGSGPSGAAGAGSPEGAERGVDGQPSEKRRRQDEGEAGEGQGNGHSPYAPAPSAPPAPAPAPAPAPSPAAVPAADDFDAQLAAALAASMNEPASGAGGAVHPPMMRADSTDSVQRDIERALGRAKVIRTVPLWHINGLENGDRTVQVFPLLVQETDTGAFAPEAMEASSASSGGAELAAKRRTKRLRQNFGQVVRTKWVGAQIKFLAEGGPDMD